MGRTAGYVAPCGSGLELLTKAEQEDIGYGRVTKVWQSGYVMRQFPENLQDWNDAWSRFKAA